MLKPQNGYVLIEPYRETQRASGLIIADTKEKPMRGTIIAASGDWEYSAGAEVLYSKFGAIEIRYKVFYIKNIMKKAGVKQEVIFRWFSFG